MVGQPKRVNLFFIRATGGKPKKSCERHVVLLVNKINSEGVYMEIGSGETYSLYLQGTAINYVESLILGN